MTKKIFIISLPAIMLFFFSVPCSLWQLCAATIQNDADQLNRDGVVSSAREIIWSGTVAGKKMVWTTNDLEISDGQKSEKIFSTLARAGFEGYKTFSLGPDTAKHRDVNCTYERSFRLLSVVGSMVTFQDRQYSSCRREAHPSEETRFTTIDVSKSGQIHYSSIDDGYGMHVDAVKSGNVVKLTDLFPNEMILKSLLNDPIVKKRIEGTPASLEEMAKRIKNKPLSISKQPCRFVLSPDFLTRFAFHHLENDKVAVRLLLSPYGGACKTQTAQLGMLFPVSPSLKENLDRSSRETEGFLMKDSNKISSIRMSLLRYQIGRGSGR